MDYARKIGKSDEPKEWVKQFPTFVTARDGLISSDVIFHEDRRLLNWKKWLESRKKQYERVKSTTGRHQNDQTLNSCEKVRPLIEMRNLIDYASVPVPVIADKYRGGPEFWKTPETLPNRGASCLPDISFTPSKKELNVIPELTYVDLPELIEKEKDLVGLRSKEPMWKRSRYLMKRKNELSNEIRLLVPNEPETKGLVIKNHVPPKREAQPRIPVITISRTEDEKEKDKSCCECYPAQVVVLKIQDREIAWQKFGPGEDQTKADPITWSLTFRGKINNRAEKEIVFENKGNRVIVYQWRTAAFRSNVVPVSKQTSPFFFDKTKGVILPGQIAKLKIWYRPRSSHVATEFWRFVTSPVLCSSPLIFRFWGCAETTNSSALKSDPVRMVDEYLDRCVRNTAVREIIDDIMENVGSLEFPEPAYGSLFLESEVFAVKNPLCFYSPSLLIEFHKIYCSATNQKERRWNMSLIDLREILLKIKQPEQRSILLSQFGILYKECLKPTLYSSVRYSKHEAVYTLLCSFFNVFEIESDSAKSSCLAKEYKETSGTASEMSCTMNVSQASFKSNNSRGRRGKKSSTRSLNSQVLRIIEASTLDSDDRPYREIFFIRIYQLLGETVVRVFASIESFNNLNERDK